MIHTYMHKLIAVSPSLHCMSMLTHIHPHNEMVV